MSADVEFDAAKIKIAHPAPPACASCYGQYPERLHVDFGAAFDGPVLFGKEGATQAQVDELVICDECLRAAAALLGLKSHGDLEEKIAALNDHATELAEKLAGAMVYIRKIEDAFEHRPDPVKKKTPARKA